MKRQVNQWLKYAKVDLLSAEKLLDDELLTQSVAFHCQQVVEKSFKAVLENMNERVPRIHDLEKLYGMLKERGFGLSFDEDVLAQINDVYLDSRYPADIGLIPDGIPSVAKVRQFYNAVQEVYGAITIDLND